MARTGGVASRDALFGLAKTDPDPSVQAQAVRAIADLSDPVFTKHRLDAGRGDPAVAARLARLARGADPRVVLEIIVALGRLRWTETPAWLRQALRQPDAALAHAAMQALRRVEDWPAVLRLLDLPSTDPLRAIARRACADRFVPRLVDGLIARLRTDADAGRRREYAELLTRVYRKPGPWVYWGYRPPPRPSNTVAWERTEAIGAALDQVLADPDRSLRLAVLQRVQKEKIPARLTTLERWLHEERQADRVAALLAVLRDRPAAETRGLLAAVVREKTHTPGNRLAALALLAGGLDQTNERQLLELAKAVEDGPVLSALLEQLGKRPRVEAASLLMRKLHSPAGDVRAAALDALAERNEAKAKDAVAKLLEDKDARVRRSAAAAAGKLGIPSAREALLKLARDADPAVCRASLDALRRLGERRALPIALAALTNRDTAASALEYIGTLGGPDQAGPLIELAKRDPAAQVLLRVVRILSTWEGRNGLADARRRELNRAVAELQGDNGVLLRWQGRGPLPAAKASAVIKEVASSQETPAGWRTRVAAGTKSAVTLEAKGGGDVWWLACTDVRLPAPTAVQFLAAASGPFKVWLNGRLAYQRDRSQGFRLDSDPFSAVLAKGPTRILVQVAARTGPVQFHLRYRRTSSRAEHEQLTQAALSRKGDPERGRALFLNADKTQCLKCHRLGDQGGRIGPDLTGVGGRFSRIYLIESILEPSRTIAPSYQTWMIILKDGRQLSGIKLAETDQILTVGDNQGTRHEVKKADIDKQRPVPQSTMPDGLEKRLTTAEFVDLIAFLASRKEGRAK
jgi:putative heme-binding domain-containing protein